MGCCPSKQKADKGAEEEEYPPTEKIDVDFTLSDRSTHGAVEARGASAVRQAPRSMLMDRGDGHAMEHSDHESMNECGVDGATITVSIEAGNQRETTASTIMPIQFHESIGAQSSPARPQLSITAPSPSRPPAISSPSKTPVNFEDMPINSMYHRIHSVEVEEIEARRRQELEEEAARREREIEEFKAAMLTSASG